MEGPELGSRSTSGHYADATQRALDGWDDVANALDKQVKHLASEIENDVDHIVATISDWDVHYSLLQPSTTGLRTEFVSSKADAHAYYTRMRHDYNVIKPRHVKRVASTWYVFIESISFLEALGHNGAPNVKRFVPSAALLPLWTDGILGEIGWNRFDWDLELAKGWQPLPAVSISQPYIPAPALRSHGLEESIREAISNQDPDAFTSLLAEDSLTVVRTVNLVTGERGRYRIRGAAEHRQRFLNEALGKVHSIRATNFIAGDWYVFVEYLMSAEVAGKLVDRKMAALLPITEDGRVIGMLAYALERPTP